MIAHDAWLICGAFRALSVFSVAKILPRNRRSL